MAFGTRRSSDRASARRHGPRGRPARPIGRGSRARGAGLAILLSVASACGGGGGDDASPLLAGFSAIPPRPDPALQIATLELAVAHSTAALIQLEIPWTTLLAGTSPEDEIRQERLPLVDYYRDRGLPIVVALDVTDGLDRTAEAPALVDAGRSITEPEIQDLYRAYVEAVARLLRPAYLSLAAETNLIRLAADPDVYAAVVAMTNAAAADLDAARSRARRMISVQVETAWGLLQGTGVYVGVAQDRADFPFIEVLALSSYPFVGRVATPAALPDDYYARLVEPPALPTLVLEGGWPSADVGPIASSPALQADYVLRQAELLDRAAGIGIFQITFTDLDLDVFPPALGPFAHLGLVDVDLLPKPALEAWDAAYLP